MKYKNIIGFILVVAVVATLWFISKYKDTYQEEVLFNINFVDIPDNLILNSNYQKIEIPVEIEASGFVLIWEKMFGHQMELSFKDNTYSRNDSLFFNFSKSIKNLKRSKSLSYQVLSTDDLEIHMEFQKFKSKKIPVRSKINIEYTNNYLAIKDPYFQTDSVTITGNDEKVASLNELFVTQDSKLSIEDSLTTLEIDLKEIDADLNYKPQNLLFTVKARQMTEGKIDVPVQLINVPTGYDVKLIPDNVQVIFSTAVSNFDRVSKEDFTITVNYELINDLNISATPSVKTSNNLIKSYRINPKQVQVLTIK